MTTILKINVDALDSKFMENLKKEHADSELEIFVHDPAEAVPAFTDDDFWQLIGLLDWSDESDDQNIVEPVILALESRSLADIYRFYDLLAEKLWHLDTRYHARVFLNDHEAQGILSVDDFLYARCAVVANGKEYYEKVLVDPSIMPEDLTFEPLLYIASQAYKRKTGKEFLARPAFGFETYSNKEGWTNE